MTKHVKGCILDHGARNNRELSEDIVSYAENFGFKIIGPIDGEDEDSEEFWDEVSEEAIDFLNSLDDLPDGHYYGNDGYAGAFGLWSEAEEDE